MPANNLGGGGNFLPGSSGGVVPKVGARSPGQVGRPGPGPPGLSRFWVYLDAPVNQPDQAFQPGYSQGSLIGSAGGVVPKVGARSPGQIARPGPGPPGLSRFWVYLLGPVNQPTQVPPVINLITTSQSVMPISRRAPLSGTQITQFYG
jgi:hypothetical protein